MTLKGNVHFFLLSPCVRVYLELVVIYSLICPCRALPGVTDGSIQLSGGPAIVHAASLSIHRPLLTHLMGLSYGCFCFSCCDKSK